MWTAENIGDLSGLWVLVTGGNSGIGLEVVRMLGGHGAHVILACRDLAKGHQAAASVLKDYPDAAVELLRLDLADLDSVAEAAESVGQRYDRLDVLVNNAGVMAVPYRHTLDGFELQFGTNHLGHFALTGRLLALLLAAPSARVVTVSSSAHRMGRIDFDNLDGSRGYNKWRAYCQSKLANLLFTFELQRRADTSGADVLAVAAHPGYAATNLQRRGPQMSGSRVSEWGAGLANRLFAQSAAAGALPILYAATAADIRSGDYIGPDGRGEVLGYPTKVGTSAAARDLTVAGRLWTVSEELTGVRYSWSSPI
jgi:NAD(P)-dependent dehydrogenase (short-subunit alcohol dehydrogenase family)